MAERGMLVAVDRQRPLHRDARRVHRHQDHRLLPVLRCRRVALAHDDGDLAARRHGPGRPPFASLDDIVVAVAKDRGLDVGGVGGGDARLGHGEAGADLAFEQGFEPALLLLGRAVDRQDLHVADVGGVAVEHLRRGQRTAEGLAEVAVFVVGEPGALGAVVVEQVPQALRAGLALQLLHQPLFLPAGGALARLVEDLPLVRVDVFGHEGLETALQFVGPV